MKSVIESAGLPNDNEDRALKLSAKDQQDLVAPLLVLLMQVADDIGNGKNTWFSWGATKEKTSYTATLYQFAGPITIYDQDAVSLLRRVAELL